MIWHVNMRMHWVLPHWWMSSNRGTPSKRHHITSLQPLYYRVVHQFNSRTLMLPIIGLHGNINIHMIGKSPAVRYFCSWFSYLLRDTQRNCVETAEGRVPFVQSINNIDDLLRDSCDELNSGRYLKASAIWACISQFLSEQQTTNNTQLEQHLSATKFLSKFRFPLDSWPATGRNFSVILNLGYSCIKPNWLNCCCCSRISMANHSSNKNGALI